MSRTTIHCHTLRVTDPARPGWELLREPIDVTFDTVVIPGRRTGSSVGPDRMSHFTLELPGDPELEAEVAGADHRVLELWWRDEHEAFYGHLPFCRFDPVDETIGFVRAGGVEPEPRPITGRTWTVEEVAPFGDEGKITWKFERLPGLTVVG